MSWDKVERDVERGPGGLFKWIAITVIFFAVLFTGLNYVGLIGGTAVKREVFEQSYQYQAGQEARGAILEANLIEVNEQIARASTSEEREALQGQKRVIEAQLRAIRINQ